jgi:hypothetical protein
MLARPFPYHPPDKECRNDLLSLRGLWGEEDFSCRRYENARLPAEIAGILETKKVGYALDMGAFWLGGKSRIRAERDN